ncbi:Transmembrane protease serine 6 [Tyrophagus putrescentiae]|nr:Transmembrane protease serine 6 [Tyrophagus putrescentiae]
MHLSSIAVFLRCVLLALPLTVHSQPTANFNNNNNNISSNDQMTENKQERSILGIINGHEVPEGKYPFIVSLQSGDRPCGDTQPGYHFCAGTIINDNTILTAAHCLKDEDTSNGKQGTNWDREGFCYQVGKMVQHPHYQSTTRPTTDIAILKLTTPIDFEKLGSHVASPVCLPPRRDHPVNTQCVVIGWGRVEGGKDATHLREKDGDKGGGEKNWWT